VTKKFKDYYDEEYAELIGKRILSAYPEFKLREFIVYIKERINDKSFTQRQDLIVDGFELFMTGSYENDIKIFIQILGEELSEPKGMFTEGWWLWPVGRYVERKGLHNRILSIEFIYELTKRFTGEFAIRPLLIDNPKETLEVLLRWSLDENVHVRRLASEGMRINLPWAKKSVAVLECFELYKEILSNLKADTEKFIMKSVGNNLNDLMKERPELAKIIIDEWQEQKISKNTEWIIKHGKRSIKRNNN